jgi:hypothetical protein
VCLRVDATLARSIAATIAEEVEYDETMSSWNERNDFVPQMTRRRKSVDEHGRHSGTSCSGGVVVQPGAGEIEKLTAHASLGVASGAEDE